MNLLGLKFSSLGFMVALIMGSTNSLQAMQVYSAVEDFSTTVNAETSTWSYRFSDDLLRDGSYQLLTNFSELPRSTWNPSNPYWNESFDGGATIGVNNSGDSLTFTGNPNTFLWPNNTIWMHPGNGLAITSWLSPIDGIANIDFSFADIDPNGADPDNDGTGIAWFVDINDSNGLLASGIIDEGGSGTGSLSLSNIRINAGDRINFIVDPNGNRFFDSTGFTSTISITSVPESQPLNLLSILVSLGIGGTIKLLKKSR